MGILNMRGKNAKIFETIDDVINAYDKGMLYGLQESNPAAGVLPAALRPNYQGSRKDGFTLSLPVVVANDNVGNVNYKQMIDPTQSGKVLDAIAEAFGWAGEGRKFKETRWSQNQAHYDLFKYNGVGNKIRAKLEVYVDNRREIPNPALNLAVAVGPANPATIINPLYGKTDIIYRMYDKTDGDEVAKDFNKIYGALRKVKGLFAQLYAPGNPVPGAPLMPAAPAAPAPTPTP